MKMIKVTIGKREFSLAFTMDALDRIEGVIPDFDLAKISQYAKRSGFMVDILYAMAQQGELLEGRKLDVDRAWFGSHIPASPKKIAEIQVAVFNAMTDAMKMESETEEAGEVDVDLEEIKKKETREN
jgi:hypothetical protein